MAPKVIFTKLNKNDGRLNTINKISPSCPYYPALWSLIQQLNLVVFVFLLLLMRYIWPASWAGLGFGYRRKQSPKAAPKACCTKKPLCVALLVQSVFDCEKKSKSSLWAAARQKTLWKKLLECGTPNLPPHKVQGLLLASSSSFFLFLHCWDPAWPRSIVQKGFRYATALDLLFLHASVKSRHISEHKQK